MQSETFILFSKKSGVFLIMPCKLCFHCTIKAVPFRLRRSKPYCSDDSWTCFDATLFWSDRLANVHCRNGCLSSIAYPNLKTFYVRSCFTVHVTRNKSVVSWAKQWGLNLLKYFTALEETIPRGFWQSVFHAAKYISTFTFFIIYILQQNLFRIRSLFPNELLSLLQ